MVPVNAEGVADSYLLTPKAAHLTPKALANFSPGLLQPWDIQIQVCFQP
jgi:hypothetical protein